MKTYTVSGEGIIEGIAVDMTPYPHITLGDGGHKRATWIALGKRDADRIITADIVTDGSPDEGRPVRVIGVKRPHIIEDAAVIALKDPEGKPNGKHLIVAPRGADNRALVLWRVPSGYRGGASISAGEGVVVVATDSSWHSGRGNLGSTAEMLAILALGQELHATRSGRRVQETKAVLRYDGKNILVTFGGEELAVATADQVEGEYV